MYNFQNQQKHLKLEVTLYGIGKETEHIGRRLCHQALKFQASEINVLTKSSIYSDTCKTNYFLLKNKERVNSRQICITPSKVGLNNKVG